MDRGRTVRLFGKLVGPLGIGGPALTLAVLLAACGTGTHAAVPRPAANEHGMGPSCRTPAPACRAPSGRGARKRDIAPVKQHDGIFVPVLIYHHVKWLKPSDDAIERGLTVLPSEFQAELFYLQRNHFHTVTANQLVSFLRTGAPLPSRPVVISFDDGYRDMAQTAYPMLRRYHMTATFFIVPGFLGSLRYLTWPQVEDMARHGMDVEAHTMTHPDLTLVSSAQVRGELTESRRLLQQHLHRPVRIFAYPYGDYNAAVLRAVAAAGYWAAFTTHQGWVARRDRLLTLPRDYVDLDDSVSIFAGRLRADPRTLAADPT